jgi:hydroxylamine dehydrogenase
MNVIRPCLLIAFLLINMPFCFADEMPVSDATAECIECHRIIHPGIVSGWEKSRHGKITPEKAMAVKGLARKVSSQTVPENLAKVVVGCAECHNQRPEAHADTFEHNGYDVHTVVSPEDCAICHKEEARQYSGNIMSHAYGNLVNNEIYQMQQDAILGIGHNRGANPIAYQPAVSEAEACLYCHGTKLSVSGSEVRDTELAGELEFPVIDGWPNQGVGRINLDGSRGSCSACHTRHQFSIEMARKPYTCKECHIGPDVPAFKVYTASKHGNIFSAHQSTWEFESVPWTIGQDFTAPTCAACHISLLVNTDGDVVAQRTHQMNNRLPWRIFGLIYAHPHPLSPDTTQIRNKDNLPLPTDFEGGTADKFLIGKAEMDQRRKSMQAICLNCHGTAWVAGHWERFENTIRETNAKTLAATRTMSEIWRKGYARGLSDPKANPFDEAVEKQWVDTWLFYANTTRFASAMAGGGDYGVYADGRYHLNKRIAELSDWLFVRDSLKALEKE